MRYAQRQTKPLSAGPGTLRIVTDASPSLLLSRAVRSMLKADTR